MKMLLLGLKKLGFDKEASLVMSRWNGLPPVLNAEPVVEYQYAYPEGLMAELVDTVLAGLKESRFVIISPSGLERHSSDTVIKQLNEAWVTFWNKPDEFRNWEEKCIEKLKAIVAKES
jgi:hypothetical protein